MAVNLTLNKDKSLNNIIKQRKEPKSNISFSGVGDIITNTLIASDKSPMIGVSIIDLGSMIFPRTVVDATRNGFAATETFLRESAGLIINCLIPSFIVLGAAKLLEKPIMGEDFSQYKSYRFWVNQTNNDTLTSAWLSTANIKDKNKRMQSFVATILDNIEGLAGKNDWRKVSNLKNKDIIYKNIANAITNNDKKALDEATNMLISNLMASRNIRLINSHTIKPMEGLKSLSIDNNLKNLINEMKDLGSTFAKLPDKDIPKFNKQLTKLIKSKSFLGLAIIIAMGASFQYFNRMLTKYRTGSSEFVGESDYLEKIKKQKHLKKNQKADENKKLTFHKIVGVLSMAALAVLSFGKVPTARMFQFNGIFPTMNQCRAISAVTYSGRIISATSDNELKETALRDTCTFINLYYLGDYVSKLFATYKEKFGGMKGQLLNETCALPKNANGFQRFWHWFKHTELKGFEELANNPVIKRNRAYAQASSLLYSCIVLGLIVPLYNKYRTTKSGKLKQQIEQQKPEESKETIENLLSKTTISSKETCNFPKNYQKKLFTDFIK